VAINVRIPPQLDEQLDLFAARDHISKHALILQSVDIMVRSRARRDEIDVAVDYVLDHDAELLTRLADA